MRQFVLLLGIGTALGCWLALPIASLRAQQPPTEARTNEPMDALRDWLASYRRGAFRLQKDGTTDAAAIATAEQRMRDVAALDTLPAAQLLFEVATVDPRPPGATESTELIVFHREMQPWLIQRAAQDHLRAMRDPGIVPWLLQKLSAKGIRGEKGNPDQLAAIAALRVLGGHRSVEAKLALLQACGSMPDDLRVHAVNAMARDAGIELVPTLLDQLRDKEPNIRIAAANAIGTAMQPHTDEAAGKEPTGEVLKQRDQVVEKLQAVLLRDDIWQVRSAAAFALANLKCKAAIPALIQGLDAELKRKKDPWAMDVRLHRILEGLTGQSVARGGVKPWQDFWKQEGPSFRVRPTPPAGEQPKQNDRYDRFFDLTIESDRVLFVLDFSGSMAEPIEIAATGTGAGGATQVTKAELVVRELKKMVMSLPDGALVNFVVFSGDVRMWRSEGGRPALVRLTDEVRDDLLGSFLDSLRPNGPTNLYDALQAALGFGGRGLYDKYYGAGFDTLYVISDGAPSAGAVLDKQEIRQRVREANNLRKITIHCITFGNKNDTDFLKPMAEENGGRHIHVE